MPTIRTAGVVIGCAMLKCGMARLYLETDGGYPRQMTVENPPQKQSELEAIVDSRLEWDDDVVECRGKVIATRVYGRGIRAGEIRIRFTKVVASGS